MQKTEEQQLVLDIIEHAHKKQYTKFHRITSWKEYRFYYGNRLATKLIIKALKSSSKNLFKEYCKDVEAGTQDFSKLLAFSQIRDITTFYELDLVLIRNMLDEYDKYLNEGNFWRAVILEEEREI